MRSAKKLNVHIHEVVLIVDDELSDGDAIINLKGDVLIYKTERKLLTENLDIKKHKIIWFYSKSLTKKEFYSNFVSRYTTFF